jgi:RNA polymerase sigma-70 factor, ECF subfamily
MVSLPAPYTSPRYFAGTVSPASAVSSRHSSIAGHVAEFGRTIPCWYAHASSDSGGSETVAGRPDVNGGCEIDIVRGLGSTEHAEREAASRRLFSQYYEDLVEELTRHPLGLLRVDAEEIAADALLRIILEPARFDRDRGSLRTYSRAIAANLARDLRRRQRRSADAALIPEGRTWPSGDLRGSARHEHLRALLHEALGTMPPASRVATQLHLEGLSIAETAVRLGVEPGAVRTRLSRARLWLRARLAPSNTAG